MKNPYLEELLLEQKWRIRFAVFLWVLAAALCVAAILES
jgi:hypothetical protein